MKNWHGDILSSSKALAAKSLWRCVGDSGLWGRIAKKKYIEPLFVYQWLIRNPSLSKKFQIFGKPLFKQVILFTMG